MKLLQKRVLYRILELEKSLGVDLESSSQELVYAFPNLVDSLQPICSIVFIEQGLTKKERSIELMY